MSAESGLEGKKFVSCAERGLEGKKFVSFGPIYDSGCSECDESGFTEEYGDEGGFSYSQCGICGSRLGGDRYVWHWVDGDGEIMHEHDGCTDCLVYISNGDEPEEWEG